MVSGQHHETVEYVREAMMSGMVESGCEDEGERWGQERERDFMPHSWSGHLLKPCGSMDGGYQCGGPVAVWMVAAIANQHWLKQGAGVRQSECDRINACGRPVWSKMAVP